MKALFNSVFYGFTSGFIKRNVTNLKNVSFLKAAAKCVRKFTIMNVLKPLQALTAEQWPFLKLLETCIESVDVSNYIDLSKKNSQIPLYVLHRLLDHGVAKYLSIHGPCPIMLAWLLHGRGSQFTYCELRSLMEHQKTNSVSASARADGATCIPASKSRTSEDCEDEDIPCKRFKLDSVLIKDEEGGKRNFAVDPQILCQMFTPCDSSLAAATCRQGQIEHLQLHECGSDCLQVLLAALPTFFCLRSLILNSSCKFVKCQLKHYCDTDAKHSLFFWSQNNFFILLPCRAAETVSSSTGNSEQWMDSDCLSASHSVLWKSSFFHYDGTRKDFTYLLWLKVLNNYF